MINPELRRYAWLELGLHRLIIVPLVLAVIVAMPLVGAESPADVLMFGALGLFSAFTLGWGTMRAYASVSEEVRDRTWDFQRMAAIDPWSLAWGKMIGAPLLAWYIGGWCLVVYMGTAIAAQRPGADIVVLGAVAMAVLLHALGVAVSALGARVLGERGRRSTGVVILGLLVYAAPPLLGLAGLGGDNEQRVHWWIFRDLPPRVFLACSLVPFAAWSAFAAWRAMARELREPGWWWPWPAFAAYVALWWGGFSSGELERAILQDTLGIAAIVLVVAAYLGASLDPLTPVNWARMQRAAGTHRMPGWLLNTVLALVLGGLALAIAFARTGALQGSPLDQLLKLGLIPVVAPALALMLLRDTAILTCFSLTTRVRRPLTLAALYIALADLLIPGFLAVAGVPHAAMAVFPMWALAKSVFLGIGGLALHAIIARGVLWWRVRKIDVIPDGPPAAFARGVHAPESSGTHS